MTEAEAKKLWCPFVRFTHPYSASDGDATEGWNNRDSTTESCCIASQCMAWRWEETYQEGELMQEGIATEKGFEQFGYCGLAGKP